jgi:hypothetical protein
MNSEERVYALSVKIGYLDVPVWEVFIDGDDMGEFKSGHSTKILIDHRLTGWAKVQTLIHEIFHAAAWIGSQHSKSLDEETWVDFAAKEVSTIIRDNPHLITWISKQIHENWLNSIYKIQDFKHKSE